jgi:hypothetical protein
MKRIASVAVLMALAASSSQASFFKELVDSVQKTAEDTARQVVIQTTAQMIRDMIIGYTTVQTKTDKEVADEYARDNEGNLPVNTRLSSYRTEILPGAAVSPGTEVRVKSYIEVIPGSSGDKATIEERLTIWDNEDNTLALKSMTKQAGKKSGKGGAFNSEFSFTLPEGLPQGVYPISTDLMLNGEQVGDQRHGLQLVLWLDSRGGALLVRR